MRNRQIVVISGKTCSGKTGLANLLEREFQFRVVRTRQVLAGIGEPEKSQDDRAALIERGLQADKATDSKWLLYATQEVLKGLDPTRSIVIDHLSTPAQVAQFRKVFGEDLIHVHLYASNQTLQERYARTEGQQAGAPPYAEIDHLKDEGDIRALKDDADVRIYTTRSDARDTLVRVAARLHLYTPPEIRCVDVLIGGQYGSEGKGNVVSYLAREYDVIVRVGGPNAGHTVASAQGPYTYHHLPSGARDVDSRLLLGPGMTIRLKGLFDEICDCDIGPGGRLVHILRPAILREGW